MSFIWSCYFDRQVLVVRRQEEAFARSLRAQFDALVDAGALRRLPL
jgi:hypothetical protein